MLVRQKEACDFDELDGFETSNKEINIFIFIIFFLSVSIGLVLFQTLILVNQEF